MYVFDAVVALAEEMQMMNSVAGGEDKEGVGLDMEG